MNIRRKTSIDCGLNWFPYGFAVLLVLVGLWWIFVLPEIPLKSLQIGNAVVAISLSAVVGILIVSNIFAFAKVDEARKSIRNIKPKYLQILKNDKDFVINNLREQIIGTITNSLSVEERENLLEKLFYVSVLCGVVKGYENSEYLESLKADMVKNGYNDRDALKWFNDYVLEATVDEMEFFVLIEEVVTSAGYSDFSEGEKLVNRLTDAFYIEDSIVDNMWTIRGGKITSGFIFKLTITAVAVTVSLGFLIVPAIGEAAVQQNTLWNVYRIAGGIITTFGVVSFGLITRYIFKVVAGKY